MSATRTPQGLEDERRELGEALPAYEIGDVLGRGSFAVVYAARHIRLEREVAVKRLSRELLGNGEAGAFVREFVRVTGIPMVLEGVPVGNTVTKAITDKDFDWRDSWVQWLIGSDDFTGLRKLHDAGVIGVMFGVSFAEGETCPCDAAQDGVTNAGKYAKRSISADDDGGYFADRVRALRKAGGLPLP